MIDVTCGQFDWDSSKNDTNYEKHGIDFETAIEIFEAPHYRISSDRNGETRWIAIGEVSNRVLTVVFTKRNGRVRIISARVARTKEREEFYQHYGGGSG